MAQLTKEHKKLLSMVSVGLMAALVFVGNYLQIKIPVAIGDITRIHLGNSMCLLAGLLFGPTAGGLASGIGAALYDMLDPVYILSSPYTFCSKFAMGFLAGLVNRYFFDREKKAAVWGSILAGAVGQIAYIVLYLFKSYVSLLFLGTSAGAALVAILPKVATSSVNAVAGIIISVPLFFALKKALSGTDFFALIHTERKEKARPSKLTAAILAVGILAMLLFFIYLSVRNKL